MADQSPQKWAESFAADLVLDGERVPFDRVVDRHRQAVAGQRAKGLTWQNLANLLRRAGAVRGNGKAYTADHLRVAFGRTGTDTSSRPANQATARLNRGRIPSDIEASAPPASQSSAPPTPSQPQISAGQGSKDVSDDELGLAMDRINKLRKQD